MHCQIYEDVQNVEQNSEEEFGQKMERKNMYGDVGTDLTMERGFVIKHQLLTKHCCKKQLLEL